MVRSRSRRGTMHQQYGRHKWEEKSGAIADVIKVATQAMQVEMILTRGVDTQILASALGPPPKSPLLPFVLETCLKEELLDLGLEA